MKRPPPSEIQEFSGALCDRPRLIDEYLAFVLSNLTVMKVEDRRLAADLRIRARVRSAGGFTLFRSSFTGGMSGRNIRSMSEIAQGGRDRFHLCMKIRGRGRISQFGRSIDAAPGSYALVSESDPVVVESSGEESGDIDFMLPQAFVGRQLQEARNWCVRSHGENKSMQNLLLSTLWSFGRDAWGLTHEEFSSSARVMGDLVLLAVGGCSNSSGEESAARVPNLSLAKQIIRSRLGEPDLTLAKVAQEVGVSLRYLHKLFHADGQTMYEFLKAERLRKARLLLEAPRSRRTTITDVFWECGFSDKSYFSRAFKQQFGIAPSELLAPRKR